MVPNALANPLTFWKAGNSAITQQPWPSPPHIVLVRECFVEPFLSPLCLPLQATSLGPKPNATHFDSICIGMYVHTHVCIYMCVYNIHIRMAMYMPSQLSRKFSALSKKYFKNHVDFVGSKLFIGNVLPDTCSRLIVKNA